MADVKTAAKKETIKSKKLTQADMNAVEKRLALSGGSLFIEFSADLANRNGTWQDAEKKLRDQIAEKSVKFERIDYHATDEEKKEVAEIRRKIRDEIPALRKREISEYHKGVEEYFISEYGDEIRKEGLLVGYGERIYIDKKRHYKKYW